MLPRGQLGAPEAPDAPLGIVSSAAPVPAGAPAAGWRHAEPSPPLLLAWDPTCLDAVARSEPPSARHDSKRLPFSPRIPALFGERREQSGALPEDTVALSPTWLGIRGRASTRLLQCWILRYWQWRSTGPRQSTLRQLLAGMLLVHAAMACWISVKPGAQEVRPEPPSCSI